MKLKLEKYDRCMQNITELILKNSSTLGTFYKELLFFTHYIDPIFEYGPESRYRSLDDAGQKIEENHRYSDTLFNCARRYEKEFCRLFDCTAEDYQYNHFNIALFVLVDVYNLLFQQLADVRMLSILVNMFWQDIIIGRCMYQDDPVNQAAYIKLYFKYHNQLLQIPKTTARENEYIFAADTFFHLFQILLEQAALSEPEYQAYQLTLFFGAIPQKLNKLLNNILKNGKEKQKEALFFYFKRTKNDSLVKYTENMYETEDYYEEWYLAQQLPSSEKTDKNEGGMAAIRYQALLRKILIHCYENLTTLPADLILFLTSPHQTGFLKELKNQIRSNSIYTTQTEKITSLLWLINSAGGLNLLQFSSFKKLEDVNVDIPLGYITGDF